MRISSLFFHTTKEVPADATVASHRLLIRSGMIFQQGSGLYVYSPLALRVLRKIEAVIDSSMEEAGYSRVHFPIVQQGSLWKKSGRWDHYGSELLRFEDRKKAAYVLGPTHEEAITEYVSAQVESYKQLPTRVYQVQTKFRDELRPRFGLMRAREFLMMDGYSFDSTPESAQKSYEEVRTAYVKIFKALGLNFRIAQALSGNIGGSNSEEFHVLAETGEDELLFCKKCPYCANTEKVPVILAKTPFIEAQVDSVTEVPTPGATSVEDVSAVLSVPSSHIVKTMLYTADGVPLIVLCPGDRQINEVKLKSHLGATELRFAGDSVITEVTGGENAGFIGPLNLKKQVRILADNLLENAKNIVTGANKPGFHLRGVSIPDLNPEFTQLCLAHEGDLCPSCQNSSLEKCRGIEVGHVFLLGDKYSRALDARFTTENGKSEPFLMGCYGIGVTRIMAAAIEQSHDQAGIIWPVPIAPYLIGLVCVQPKNTEILAAAEKIYASLEKIFPSEVLFDDRDKRAGIKFNDMDLIGLPYQIILGEKSLSQGKVEVKNRLSGETASIRVDVVSSHMEKIINDEKS